MGDRIYDFIYETIFLKCTVFAGIYDKNNQQFVPNRIQGIQTRNEAFANFEIFVNQLFDLIKLLFSRGKVYLGKKSSSNAFDFLPRKSTLLLALNTRLK